jgi:membrane-bound lytic murein transglycosylase B
MRWPLVPAAALALASCTSNGADSSSTPRATRPVATVAPAEPAPTGAPGTATGTGVTSITSAPPLITAAPDRARPVDEWGQPVPPASPAELARRLVAVEDGARAGDAARNAAGAAGHEHQVLVRALARNPAWRAQLAHLVPAATMSRADALVAAGSSSSSTLGTPLAVVPAWRIRAPQPAAELRQHYAAAEAATGTPWTVLAAINLVESRMGRIVGTSSAGARGPMQFLPETWSVYGQGGDPFDDGDAIAAAARLLADRGAPADMTAALHAYNPSDAYVTAVLGYAAVLAADPWMYDLLWGWQVYLGTVAGLQWLPEGFEAAAEVPLAEVAPDLPPPVPPARPPEGEGA